MYALYSRGRRRTMAPLWQTFPSLPYFLARYGNFHSIFKADVIKYVVNEWRSVVLQ